MGAPAAPTPQYHHATPLDNRGRPVKAMNQQLASSTTPEDLEATYTSLVQAYLQVMNYENATFMAERMVASFRSTNAWYLLGVCHYRSNAVHRALSVLENNAASLKSHPASAYLMAKCCFQLQQYGRAEDILLETARADYRKYKADYNSLNNAIKADDDQDQGPMGMEEWIVEASPCPIPNGATGLFLLGNVCRKSNRKRRAMEYYRMSLQLDPLMWTSYEALCEMGATDIDPTSVFGVRPKEIDQLQERMQQQNLAAQESMPLQEKSVLTPHHFAPPTPGTGTIPGSAVAGGAGAAGRPMEFGTPAGGASIGPKAALFQTAQKPTAKAEPGSTAILPNHLQFDTPGLTPIPMQHDASFLQHNQEQYHPASAAGVTFQQPSMISEADTSFHGFGDSLNPHTVRRAKHVAARLYYQPSPETPQYNRGHGVVPPSGRVVQFNSLAEFGGGAAPSTRHYLRGKSALQTPNESGIPAGTNISETPMRRGGGRASDVSTVRRPRTLFLSENKAMRENTNDLNQSNSAGLEDHDAENNFRPLRSRSQQDGEATMDDENHPDDEQPNMMVAEDNGVSTNAIGGGIGQPVSLPPEDEKPFSTSDNPSDAAAVVEEDALMERHNAVQQILELFCVMGAGYWRLCQFRCREALQLFNALPRVQHNTGWVLHQEGRAYFEMADYKNAQRSLESMQRVEPHRMKGLELLSTVLWQLKREVDLAHLAQRAVDFDRLSPEAWCVVGNCFSLQKEHETALVFFARCLQLDQSFTYTHTLSGYEYMANEDFDKAMSCFRNAIQSDERHYNAWYGIGAIYHRQEKFDLAEYHFQRAVQINPQSSVLRCNLGMSQFSNGKPIQALHTLSEAFRLDPQNPQARYQRATIYSSLNRPEEALEELEKVRDAAPREATVHFVMGKVLKRLGRPEQAMRCFLTALDLDPKDNQLIKSAMDKLEEPDVLDEEVAPF